MKLNLQLRHKLIGLVLATCMAPLIGSYFLYQAASEKSRLDELVIRTKSDQVLIERINQIVYAAVMDSRGIYMSADWSQASQFAKGLLASLKNLEVVTATLAKDALASERAQVAELQNRVREFVKLRSELVRVAETVSIPAGRAIGDNDSNRANRKALNDSISQLSKRYGDYAEKQTPEADAQERRFYNTLLVVVALPVLGILVGWFLVTRGVSRPIGEIRGSIVAMAQGNLRNRVFGCDREDELGDIGKAVEAFRSQLLAADRDREAAEARRREDEARSRAALDQAIADERALVSDSIGTGLSRLAAKDLTYRLTQSLPEAYAKLQSDFNAAMDALAAALGAVNGSANTIGASSREVTVSADDLSRRTEQQAASLEQTAAALDEITATGKKAAEGAGHARDVVSVAKTDAEKAGHVVRRTVEAMGNIEKSAQQINQIIAVIDEIAFQTNLLALNAGVEAARAGEAGRGFAVVASEVRALAQRSAEAAKEIKALISASSSQVAEGVDLVAQTGQALERILVQVTDIAAVVIDIASGAQEQATGLQEINTAINQMDQATQQNAAMVEETTAASHTLANEAHRLNELVSEFRVAAAAPAERPRVEAAPRGPARVAARPMARGGAAVARKPVPESDDWQDF
ncbi:MAG: HAMP domain-containing methyl-accepting chemotaxis protein [Hyphomicrobiaceae bacterium]|nr:HAMP domain-containing methyl-accepting chemotaxis protein [Hyphomicrobiaceae bacterium]